MDAEMVGIGGDGGGWGDGGGGAQLRRLIFLAK